MRNVLAVVVLVMALGCGKSNDASPAPVNCSSSLSILSNAGLSAFNARGCTSVTGTLIINGPELTSVELPGLTTIDGGLMVTHADALTSLSLPALTTVNGSMVVDTNGSLGSISLPLLTTVSDRLLFMWNSPMNSLSLPMLTTVGGDLDVDSNLFLRSLSLPALTSVSGTLAIVNSRFLISFNLPALSTVGVAQHIWGDAALPQCLAIAFKDHLVSAHGFTGAWTITGNDTTAICP
jgi:hypothetical protein